MSQKDWIIFVTISTITALTAPCCFAYDDVGFQYWSAASISSKINEDWKVVLTEDLRMGDDGGNLYYQHTDLGFVYSGWADWVELGLNYRQIQEKNSSDNTRPENRYHLNLTFKGKLLDLSASNRSRLEFRDKDSSEDVWRYRNKTTIKFPIELTPLKMQPYIADDVFIDLDRNDFNKNWFYAGVTFKVAKNTKLDIFYLWQAIKTRQEWEDAQILGTHFKFSF